MVVITLEIEGRTFIGLGESRLLAGLVLMIGICEFYKPDNLLLAAIEQVILGNLDEAVNVASEPYWMLIVKNG